MRRRAVQQQPPAPAPAPPRAPDPEPVAPPRAAEPLPEPEPEPEPVRPTPPPRRTEPRPAPPRRASPAPRKAPPIPRQRRRDRSITPPAPGASKAGRRVLALIAVLIVAALVFVAVKTFQPLHKDGQRARAGQGARRVERGGHRHAARAAGGDRLQALVRGQRDHHRQPRRPARRHVHAAAGHALRDRPQRADGGAEGEGHQDVQADRPRGALDQGGRPRGSRTTSAATTRAPRRRRARCGRRAGSGCRRGGTRRRASSSRPPTT